MNLTVDHILLSPYHELKKNRRRINAFFAGVILFCFSLVVGPLTDMKKVQAIQIISLVLMLVNGVKLSSLKQESSYFKAMLSLLMMWHLLVVLRGLQLSYVSIKEYLFMEFKFWPYFVPLVALIKWEGLFFRKMFDWFFYLGLFFLVFSAGAAGLYHENTGVAEYSIWTFAAGCGFLLLTWNYHTPVRRIIACLVTAVAFYFSSALGRRNIMLTEINYFLFGYLLFLFFYARRNLSKRTISIFMIAIVAVAGIYYFNQKKDSDFKVITNRMGDDSREYVFDYYFRDMDGHMLIGKGMGGTYYCPLVTEDINVEPVEDRDLIESGYLQILLNGGYVNLILFLAILVPAIFLGIFNSRNGLVKACGIIIFLWLIDMGPYGLPSLSVRYILAWIAVGVCYTKSLRMKTEPEILQFLGLVDPLYLSIPKINFNPNSYT